MAVSSGVFVLRMIAAIEKCCSKVRLRQRYPESTRLMFDRMDGDE